MQSTLFVEYGKIIWSSNPNSFTSSYRSDTPRMGLL